jgi:hypothetical protein
MNGASKSPSARGDAGHSDSAETTVFPALIEARPCQNTLSKPSGPNPPRRSSPPPFRADRPPHRPPKRPHYSPAYAFPTIMATCRLGPVGATGWGGFEMVPGERRRGGLIVAESHGKPGAISMPHQS